MTIELRKLSIVRLTGLVLTPWVVFVSSSLSLFRLNADNLSYAPSVLIPFLSLAAVAFLIGLVIIRFCDRHGTWFLSWAFLLFGPMFVIWKTLSSIDHLTVNPTAWLFGVSVTLFGGSWVLRKTRANKFLQYFSAFAVLVIISDTLILIGVLNGAPQIKQIEEIKIPVELSASSKTNQDLPNIYHILLDGFQSDIFDLVMSKNVEESLRGFTLFPKNKSHYGRTRVSIPSTFGGEIWNPHEPLTEFTYKAFNSDKSLLGLLESNGYETTAYLHKRFDFEPNRFGEVHYHHQLVADHPWVDGVFLKFWLFAFLPEFASSHILNSRFIEKAKTGELSPSSFSIDSIDVFNAFISGESHRPGVGRYTFVHLILPHPPYHLDESCELRPNKGPLAQSICATALVTRLVTRLKELNRFKNSMIIIHADHGLDFEIRNGILTKVELDIQSARYHAPRSRALLLLKFPSENSDTKLRIENAKSSLLDILPTVAHQLTNEADLAYVGNSLYKISNTGQSEPYPYYYYHQSNKEHSILRFMMKSDELLFDKVIDVSESVR